MRRCSTVLRAASLAALLAGASASHAAISVFTSEASFLSAISAAATDTFDDLVPGVSIGSGPLTRSAGEYLYNMSAGPISSLLFGAGSTGDAWLSSDAAVDTLTFDTFSPNVGAVGANVFGSDIAGQFQRRGTIVVTATDGDGTVTRTLTRTTTSSFIGFISDGAISAITVSAQQGRFRDVWPTVNNLVLANPVPEPETYALLLAGLGVVALVARRRRGDH